MLKKLKNKEFLFVVAIIFLAGFLRFFNVSVHDPYTDEVLTGFRAIKMIDYDSSLVQTTPWQWVDEVPGWMRLSFHDHPILFFLMQHFSVAVFGETVFALRLPSVLAGIASVFLIYLIAGRLINKRAGYIAGALLAVKSYHLWVSRLGIQDSAMIFFMLLALWLWIRALEENRVGLWILWGAVLGLGIITKLTILIIIPILFVYALVYKYNFIKNKFFWYGTVGCIIFCSPLWLYNLILYKNFGHFDFQISALLNQDVEKWQFRQGRQMVGDLSSRFWFFFESLRQSNSPVFNLSALLAVLSSLYLYIKNKSKLALFLLASVLLEWTWFLVVGSTYRFVVMIIPVFVLLIAYVFAKLFEWGKYKKIIYSVLFVILALEVLFTINSFFISPSWGRKNITFAQINEETRNFGFNEVDAYLEDYLTDKTSSVFGSPLHQFIADLQNTAIKKAEEKGYEKYPLVIIYDKDFNFLSRLWIFQRRLIYYGWPVISDKAMYDITGGKWDEYYREQGVEHFLYFTGVEGADFGVAELYVPYKMKSENTEFEKYLLEKGIEPEYIKNRNGQEAFKVYEF